MGHTNAVEKCIAHGPWGSEYGTGWIFMAEEFIKKISISYGEAINGIEFQSDCSKNGTQKSFFGSKSGTRTDTVRTDTICLDYPNEYLTSIRGRIGPTREGGKVVLSLCFITNQNRYGVYGFDDLSSSLPYEAFAYDGKCGMIVGFHGRASSRYIDAIGIYVIPKALTSTRHSCEEHPKKSCRISRMVMPRNAGPWGLSGGDTWDDGVFSNVKQVRLHLGKTSNAVFAITNEYVKKNGKLISSLSHGYTQGHITKEVNFDWENEHLTRISGFYGPFKEYDGWEGIISITFHTNMKEYGPYGQQRGEESVYFTSTSSPGKIVGFHGRHSEGVISAIGVHMEYF